MHKILVVEDNHETRELISEALKESGYAVQEAENTSQAWLLFERENFDLVVLDVMLPDGTGRDVCRKIRSAGVKSGVPVIMLTGEKSLEDKEAGFESGADQYLTKPMQIEELRMWVASLLRRRAKDWSEASSVNSPDISINPETRLVTVKGETIKTLTLKEFDLLFTLMKARPDTLKREELMEKIWGTDARTNTLDVHVKNLRAKLGILGGAHVVTVRGVGYRFE